MLAGLVAEYHGLEAGSVAVTLVGEGRIRRLNREFRGIDEVTDVLSFPLQDGDDEDGPVFVLPPELAIQLGDIIICWQRAVEQAEQYGHSLERELGFLFVHGLLHLLAYDHEDEAERLVMRQVEERVLAAAGLLR